MPAKLDCDDAGKTAEELTILEVVNASIQYGAFTPARWVQGVRLCLLRSRLDCTVASVEDAFRNMKLAENLAEPSRSVPLYPFSNEKLRKQRASRTKGD